MLVESEIRSPICGGSHSSEALMALWAVRIWHGCPCGSRHVRDFLDRSLPPAAARLAFDATAHIAGALAAAGRTAIRLQHPDCVWLTADEAMCLRAFEAAREGGYAVAFFEAGQLLRLKAVTGFVDALSTLSAALEAGVGVPGAPARPVVARH